MLLCEIDVDLIPIRAPKLYSPETARYTSVFQSLEAESRRQNAPDRADGSIAELTLHSEPRK